MAQVKALVDVAEAAASGARGVQVGQAAADSAAALTPTNTVTPIAPLQMQAGSVAEEPTKPNKSRRTA